jgi:replicative DNA helicase
MVSNAIIPRHSLEDRHEKEFSAVQPKRVTLRDGQNAITLSDLVLERSALGAAMLDRTQAQQLIRDASSDLFTTTTHKNIFEALCALRGEADYALLAAELNRRGHLDDIGWNALVHLDDGVVTEIPMSERIERLKELRRLRQLARLAEELTPRVYEPRANSSEIVVALYRVLAEIRK